MLSRTLAFAICAQLASCHFNELRDMKACHGIYKLNSCHASLLPPLLFGRPPLQLGNFDGGHRAKRATCIKSNHNRQQIPSLSFCLSLCSLLFPLASRNVFYEATQKCNMHFVAVLLLTCAWYECTIKHSKDSEAYIHTHTQTCLYSCTLQLAHATLMHAHSCCTCCTSRPLIATARGN